MSMMLMDDEDQIKLSFKYVNAIEYALTVSLLNIKQFFHRISKLLPLLNWLKLLNGHILLLLLLLYTVHEIIRRQYKYGIFKWCALFLWKIMKDESRKKKYNWLLWGTQRICRWKLRNWSIVIIVAFLPLYNQFLTIS